MDMFWNWPTPMLWEPHVCCLQYMRSATISWKIISSAHASYHFGKILEKLQHWSTQHLYCFQSNHFFLPNPHRGLNSEASGTARAQKCRKNAVGEPKWTGIRQVWP